MSSMPLTYLKGQLIAAFGTSKKDPTRPDVNKAAKALNVTPRTVQRWIASDHQQHQKPRAKTLEQIGRKARKASPEHQTPTPPPPLPTNRSILFQALSGRDHAQVDPHTSDLKGQLIAAFGTSKKDPTRPDVNKAAKALNVTPRTVQRWIASDHQQHQKPRAKTLEQIGRKARKAATTKRGRTAALKQARAKFKNGMRLTVSAFQGISKDYARSRTVSFDMDTKELSDGLFSAYEEDGEKGMLSFISDHSDESYGVPSWYMGDIESISVSDPYSTY